VRVSPSRWPVKLAKGGERLDAAAAPGGGAHRGAASLDVEGEGGVDPLVAPGDGVELGPPVALVGGVGEDLDDHLVGRRGLVED
jgi:hypothetical protein